MLKTKIKENKTKNKVDWDLIKQKEDYLIEIDKMVEKMKELDSVKDKDKIHTILERLKEINSFFGYYAF